MWREVNVMLLLEEENEEGILETCLGKKKNKTDSIEKKETNESHRE